MTLDECRKCQYHFRAELDNVICRQGGEFDYRVVSRSSGGEAVVVMCPSETEGLKRSKKETHLFPSFRTLPDFTHEASR